MQRIEVKNFGPLKDISLDIKDYMVFIGPQASGKSTLAKLIYFCNRIDIDRYQLLVRYGATRLTQKSVSVELFTKGFTSTTREFFGLYFKDRYLFEYEFKATFEDYSVVFKNDNFELADSFFNDFHFIDKNLSMILDSHYDTLGKGIGSRTTELYIENIINYNNGSPYRHLVRLNQENIFIPAQRYLINFLSKRPYSNDSLLERSLPDAFLVDYKRFIEMTNAYSLSNVTSDSQFAEYKKLIIELSLKILKGELDYIYEGGLQKEVLYFEKDKYVSLTEASSGQQEAVRIIETIKDLFVLMNSTKIDILNLIIEEPEAHLFPEAQRDITYLISLFANQQNSNVIITTHSPYVLASLNNLIKAHLVGQEENKEKSVGELIHPLLWVNPERLFVGYLENGGIRNIIDEETSLINHEELDGVSVDIMDKFDHLLEIQYDK